ncbi:MAG: M12 family metallo-peptidase [Dehalococcoidia bacterium]
MREGRAPKQRSVPTRLIAAGLVAGLLLLSCSGAIDGGHQTSFHDEPLETVAPGEHAKLPADLLLYPGTSGDSSVYILADVAADEDFVNRLGSGWELQIREMLSEANLLLAAIGLHIKVHSIQQWHSNDAQQHISTLLGSAGLQVERVPGHLFLAITGQPTVRYDGYAMESGSQIGVRFYLGDPRHNSSLISHEIGHLLGAVHHEDEAECTEDGCIMDQRGYAHATHWCQHHKRLLMENVASRIAAQES